MPPTTIDFYRGFEGEPEIFVTLHLDGEPHTVLHVWSALFDQIFEYVPPGPDGWTGFLLAYHCESPWWDGPWLDPDPADTIDVLRRARAAMPTDEPALKVCDAFIELLETALARSGSVSLRYE